jgi:succinyl-diaminopimelate desuccinylase
MAQLKEAIVERRAAQFSFLRDLVRTDTAIDNEQPIKSIERIAAMLELLGFEAEVYDVPEERCAAMGRPPISNIVVREKYSDGPVVALVSHLDTAPVGDDWTIDARAGKIADGKMFGRGVLSGKGHLAAHVFALLALRDVDAKLKGSIELHISFDGERGGSLGAKWMIAEGIAQPDYAIVGGPAQGLVLQSAGSMSMSVDVTGKPAPIFTPEHGPDAADAATQALSRLFQFRNGLIAKKSDVPGIGAASMAIESVSGGRPGGGIPETVSFTLSRVILPEEDLKQVEAQLTNLIGGTVAHVQGARCRIRRTRLIPPMTLSREIEPFYNILKKEVANATGFQPKYLGVAYEHEGRHYKAADIPTMMYGAGPLDPIANGMQGPDEMLELDDLRVATQVLAQGLSVFLDRARV